MSQLRCVVISDDLTGACDSAVHFKMRGARTVVPLRGYEEATVVAFTTDTRDTDSAEVDIRMKAIADHVSYAQPPIIFKKIDSLLRGNPGREIVSAYDAFGCEAMVVTPAYPEMGRTVLNGHLHVPGDDRWTPVHIETLLRNQGLSGELSRNVTCDAHLDTIVAEGLASGRRILWAGSGGLASALARALFPAQPVHAEMKATELPVLFCVGSQHPVALRQLEKLQATRSGHTVLRVPETTEGLKEFLRDFAKRVSAIFVSGGDTASKLCAAVNAEKIELKDQVVAGVPWGTLKGGMLDGAIIATKSGAFGNDETLVQVADYFTCLKP